MQAEYGDVSTKRPTWMEITERLKWNAWYDVRGMSSEDAREKFLTEAISILNKHGIPEEHPLEQATYIKYTECMER